MNQWIGERKEADPALTRSASLVDPHNRAGRPLPATGPRREAAAREDYAFADLLRRIRSAAWFAERATGIYDRRRRKVTRNIVERISI